MKDPGYWDASILHATGRLLMLAAFNDHPGHGYDIARRLSTLCGDWCNPSPAMIYPAIHELEAAGLIECELDRSSARKRRVCHLTGEGKEALRVGVEAWANFLPTMARVLSANAHQAPSSASESPETLVSEDAAPGTPCSR